MRDADIKFYGLLHIDRRRNLDANLKWTADPIDIYVSCAALAAKSARANGISFGLFTNEPDFVHSRLGRLGFEHFNIVELQSPRDVPRVKNFYSAHLHSAG